MKSRIDVLERKGGERVTTLIHQTIDKIVERALSGSDHDTEDVRNLRHAVCNRLTEWAANCDYWSQWSGDDFQVDGASSWQALYDVASDAAVDALLEKS